MDNRQLSLKLLLVLSRATESIFKNVEKDIKKYGLNTTEFGVLELLFHKGEQPIQKIGEKILLASSSITYVVDKLEKKELLVRLTCPNDRRVTYAVITEKGKVLIAEIFPQHATVLEELFSPIDEEEKKIMITQLKKLGIYAASEL